MTEDVAPPAPGGAGVVSGILALNKQPGQTSFGAVREVRRLLGERRVGHAGTLDPAARGLLPVCVGRATRLVDYFHQQRKRYRCTVRLGERSATLDREGEVEPGGDASHLDAGLVRAALGEFVGEINQVPPMYSAVRHEGEHLYALARRGEDIERQPRPVVIYSIELLGMRCGRVAEVDISVESGRGAYMRVLAGDLGESLGVGGLLSWLERTEYGELAIRDAITLDQLAQLPEPASALLPAEIAVSFLPRVDLAPPLATQVRRGQAVFLPRLAEGRPQGEARAHAANGVLIAMGEVTGNRFRPTKVLSSQ